MSSIRVMIVEDEPGLAITLADAIRRASKDAYEVIICNTPQEALAELSGTVFNLVISDLRLPGMNGLELIGKIKIKSPGTHTILMTGYGSQDVEVKAKDITDAYLTKPFHLPEVLTLIQRILSTSETVQGVEALVIDNTFSASQKIMKELCFETKAPYAMLLDLYGHTMSDSGDPGNIDKTVLNSLLISSMAASHELAHALHEKRAFDMHYYDGDRYEIYLRKVNAEIMLALLIDLRQTNIPIGGIRLHLKRAVESVKQISDQLLASDKRNDSENIELIMAQQGSSNFFNSLDDLFIQDETLAPTSSSLVNTLDEKPHTEYLSLDEAIRQGLIKTDSESEK